MIYKAVVLDNSNFFKTGTVRVRIAGYFHRRFSWNLEEDFPASIEEGENDDGTHEDFDAILFSPLGGGRNYGALFLPQINENGVVAFLGDNKKRPVWMGSIFEPKYDDNYKVEYTNIPSDDPTKEGSDSDGSVGEQQNMDADSLEDALKKNIVIRLKNTSRDDGVDWQEKPTTNIISIGEKEARLTHFSDDGGYNGTTPDKWQEIILAKNEDDDDSVTVQVKNESGSKSAVIELSEETLKVSIDGDGATIQFIGDDDNLVRHADLAEFLDIFLEHQHISPNGPTTELIDGTMKPIAIELGQLINKFKADKLQTEGS